MKTKAAHTPGPWNIAVGYDNGNGREQYQRIHSADNPNIVTIRWADYDPKGNDETAANARLIAAAPELLAVLQELLDSSIYADAEGSYSIEQGGGEMATRWQRDGDDAEGSYSIEQGGYDDEDHRAIVAKAKAAIAKAGG